MIAFIFLDSFRCDGQERINFGEENLIWRKRWGKLFGILLFFSGVFGVSEGYCQCTENEQCKDEPGITAGLFPGAELEAGFDGFCACVCGDIGLYVDEVQVWGVNLLCSDIFL